MYYPPVPKVSYLRLAFAVEYAMNVQEYSVNAWYCSLLLVDFILRWKKVRCSEGHTHSAAKLSLQTSDLFGEHLPGARCG